MPTYPNQVRSGLLFTVAGACLIALVGRLAYIQVDGSTPGTRLAEQLQEQQRSTIALSARRGEIIDAAGRVLAASQMRPSIFADPTLIADYAALAAQLAPILDTSPERLTDMLTDAARRGRRFVWLKRLADDAQADAVRALDDGSLGIIAEPQRRYPMNEIAAHVVGFVGIDGQGLEGVERRFDDMLHGRDGFLTLYRDAGRRPIWPDVGTEGYQPPQDGMTLRLTLDAAIQAVLERQVANSCRHFHAESGVGIVMEPKTGRVLALANWPTFNPNAPQDSPISAWRNRCLTDPCEPGSTFKPFVASAALAEGVVRKEEKIYCENGTYIVGTRRLHDHHPYGLLTFEQIVAKSSNIGMAKLGERLGNTRMHHYLASAEGYGFGARTGIDLPGEDPGILLPLRLWTSYSTRSVPMGQEVAVTPIQLATAFCAIVNGGELVKPKIIDAVLDAQGNVVAANDEVEVVRRVLPEAVADYMREHVLTGVVNEGTGRPAQLANYQVLGKTGTAQIARRGGRGYEPNAYTGSFLAAAPASDPAVVALIMIRKPQSRIGYYGSVVAAPAVREVLRETLAYLQVPPDKTPGQTDQLQARADLND